jgi:hypothetical protein
MSKPGSLGSMQVSFIGLLHLPQGMTPISAMQNKVVECVEIMTLTLGSGERLLLSVTDGCRWRDGDGDIMTQRNNDLLVNIAHLTKNRRALHSLHRI